MKSFIFSLILSVIVLGSGTSKAQSTMTAYYCVTPTANSSEAYYIARLTNFSLSSSQLNAHFSVTVNDNKEVVENKDVTVAKGLDANHNQTLFVQGDSLKLLVQVNKVSGAVTAVLTNIPTGNSHAMNCLLAE